MPPQIGYFVIDNLAVDLLLNVGTASQSSDGYDYSATSLGIGLGARYFFLNFYGGLGFNYESFSTKEEVSKVEEKYSASAMYITPKIGYVLPLASNVYADFGLNYRMGIGKAKGSLEVANVETEWDSDNEYSKLQLMAGLQIFFPKK
ncbi:MAG TPA: outer membrane beta-barrel protein [Candidatus Syntrophosphaera sp.]|nr:outer membrane beta-barrel protein [Candidatus Syntrophosphaera sp.]